MKPIAVQRSWEKNSRAWSLLLAAVPDRATVRGIPKGSGQTNRTATAIIILGILQSCLKNGHGKVE